MPTRNVVLTDRQEKLIDNLVDSGRYQNASEVLREGLRLVEKREVEDAARLKVLRKAARAGFGALDRGEFKEFDSIRSPKGSFPARANDISCLCGNGAFASAQSARASASLAVGRGRQ